MSVGGPRGAHPDSVAGRIVAGTAIGVGALITGAAVTAGVIAVVFARTVVTPPKKHADDVRILSHDADTITLSSTSSSSGSLSIDAMTPGRYSLWFAHDTGHAKVGDIVSYDEKSVTRQLLGVDFGDLASAEGGRFSGWFYLSPAELGYPFENVEIETDLGAAPAWLVPAAHPSTRWVIGVHGRAVRRQEALRAIPVFREEGYTSLLISYRNDGDAPGSADNRYSLGDTEWKDVEAAMKYAVDHGAAEIVLMGWSMGGATVLQTVTRSPFERYVSGVVLESPVVDWVTALHYQGMAYRLPRVVRLGILGLLSHRWARPLTGLTNPVDLKRLDLVSRANELHKPTLLLHSDDDGYIPATASRALAVARPDIVTFVPFTTARHTRLWNYDSDRWNAAIRSWLMKLG